MWAMFLGPSRPCHSFRIQQPPTTPFCKPPVPPISATAILPHSDGATRTRQVGDLGRTLLTTLPSNSGAVNSVPKHREQNRRNQEEGEESHITGSDILWALQKASAHRKKKQKKRVVSSSASSRREEGPANYSNVRPLNVKREWGAKLDELEKRLQELSETI